MFGELLTTLIREMLKHNLPGCVALKRRTWVGRLHHCRLIRKIPLRRGFYETCSRNWQHEDFSRSTTGELCALLRVAGSRGLRGKRLEARRVECEVVQIANGN